MDLKNFYSSLTGPARLRLFVGVTLILILTSVLLWWLMTPRQMLLFGNLREGDAAEIVASLGEWKVPYEITDGGTGIAVNADQVYETRMRLISAGVPRGGHVGFELFDDADFGVTEFAQRVNYQRALQGEIERTIASMPGVETARVHLTIRRPGLFVGERETSKASVALTLKPGESLTRQQLGGIRSLVAAAVEGLDPHAVSVLDSNGGLLASASPVGVATGLDERQDEEAKLEARLQARVVELLGQVLRDEEFRVSVDATLNFDAIREVSERPLAQADGSSVLVRRHVNSSNGSEREGRSQNQEDAEYAHGTERAEISRAPGRVERLSIAVILPPSLDEHEVARIHSLVAAAAGIDSERGDRLEVSRLGRDTRWISAPPAPPPAAGATDDVVVTKAISPTAQIPTWTRLALVAIGGLLMGVIVALASQRRPRALKPAEHEAVLAKLRGWLAEGNL